MNNEPKQTPESKNITPDDRSPDNLRETKALISNASENYRNGTWTKTDYEYAIGRLEPDRASLEKRQGKSKESFGSIPEQEMLPNGEKPSKLAEDLARLALDEAAMQSSYDTAAKMAKPTFDDEGNLLPVDTAAITNAQLEGSYIKTALVNPAREKFTNRYIKSKVFRPGFGSIADASKKAGNDLPPQPDNKSFL